MQRRQRTAEGVSRFPPVFWLASSVKNTSLKFSVEEKYDA
tara:strand:+ start:170 stop:289 length:120 start_codon:yes stop_codon:yes gene_type:complete